MRYLIVLFILASRVAAQPPIHEGDHVRYLGASAGDRYRGIVGVVQESSADSATVLFRRGCGQTEQRTVPHSQLAVRVARGRHTVPYAVAGAINAFFFGKVAAHVVVHNGGGPEGARAARYGATLLIPYSAIHGYERRTPGWIPIADQTRGTEHLHVAPDDAYLDRMCSRGRPGLGHEPEDIREHP